MPLVPFEWSLLPRSLNAITSRNGWNIPRIDDLIDSFRGAAVFSTLDLISVYHQIRLLPSDVPKPAFNTPVGHFQWLVLPMGLTNAPSVFSRAMTHIFFQAPR